jgi:uncharacterized delta-60 repeat protein
VTDYGTISTARQADGKLLISYIEDGTSRATLMRLTADGAVDTTFGTGGKFTVPIPGGSTDSRITKIQVAPSGRIYAAGQYFISGANHMIAWAVTPGGAADTAFGAPNGYAVVPLAGTGGNSSAGFGLQADGDLVLAGSTSVPAGPSLVVQVISSTGALGLSTTKSFAGIDVSPTSSAMQSDGSLVVEMSLAPTGSSSIAFGGMTRFAPSGGWDAAFGTGSGYSLFGLPVPVLTQLYTLLVGPGDSLNPIGQTGFVGSVGYYTSNGLPVTAINAYGLARTLGPYPATIFSDGTYTAGGKVLAVGVGTDLTSNNAGFMARFNADGRLDTGFGNDGTFSLSIAVASFSVVTQSDGKYLGLYEESVSGKLKAFRLLGDSPPPPTVPLSVKLGTLKSKIKASKFKKISGTASGTGLSRVEVAIQRVDSALLKKSKKCVYVKSTKGSTTKVKAVKGKCSPKWLAAKGTASWSYSLTKTLPVGKYVISVRSVGSGAAVSSVSTKKVTLTKK